MKKGKFITIEGCEGVGKSTQIQLLKNYCLAHNIDAVFTREPGGTPIAERIRSIILDTASTGIEQLTELMLYASSRIEHTKKVIIPALNAGKIVFCDRYSDSTLAYQAYARGLDIAIVQQINELASCGVVIDKTIFLNVNPEVGFKRIATRGEADRMEKMGLDFHKKVYNGFLNIAKNNPNRVISIDGTKSAEDVHLDVIGALRI